MPGTNTQTASTVLDVASIATEALAQRNEEVKKEVVKKLKVIAKRQAYIQTHLDSFNKKVAEFNTALTTAASPEAIMAVLEAFKFPASSTALAAQQ